jgi:hypothetical protein
MVLSRSLASISFSRKLSEPRFSLRNSATTALAAAGSFSATERFFLWSVSVSVGCHSFWFPADHFFLLSISSRNPLFVLNDRSLLLLDAMRLWLAFLKAVMPAVALPTEPAAETKPGLNAVLMTWLLFDDITLVVTKTVTLFPVMTVVVLTVTLPL